MSLFKQQTGQTANWKLLLGGIVALLLLCCCVVLPTRQGASTEPAITRPTAEETAAPLASETPDPTATALPTATQPAPKTAAPTANKTAEPILSEQCIPDTDPMLAMVVSVVDGDTIKVLIEGEEYKVRYIGMDTPELSHSSQPKDYFGAEAAAKNEALVLGKEVLLYRDVSEVDRYDRLLRYVIVNGLFVNYELVRNGYAVAIEYPPDVACADYFKMAEEKAAALMVGLWAPLAEATLTATTAPLAAGEEIAITHIAYNGTAGDKEPDEYVVITHQGSHSIDLAGWSISDESGKTFYFPAYVMEPGQTCHIYTNQDHPESCGFNWRFTSTAIWNNGGDCATLKNAEGAVIDTYCYP